MSNLLVANIRRLVRSKIFWICFVGFFCFTVFMMVMGGFVLKSEDAVIPLDHYYFQAMLYGGMLYAGFISLYVGTEFSDGTIRNKLVVGHSRSEVYIANVLTNYLAVAAFFVAWLVGGMTGIPFFGLWEIGIKGWIINSSVILFAGFAIASIYTLVAHWITSKAICAVISILLENMFIVAGSLLYEKLYAPKMIFSAVNGTFIPNPSYISGVTRDIFKWIMRIMPSGQIAEAAYGYATISNEGIMIITSVAVAVLISCIGCIIFKKKDIK